ncbi:MAG: penicillin-binding transpeptidase domain-containing protein [Candidatus Polarisedimenticolia bacterium]
MSFIDRTLVRRRMRLLAAGLAAWGVLIGVRLADLQVVRASELRRVAAGQQEEAVRLDARRGVLYDRAGRELAVSVEVDSIAVDPAHIEDPVRAVAALAPALGLSRASEREELIGRLTESRSRGRRYLRLRRKVDPDVSAAVRRLAIKGVQFEPEHKRFYPNGTLAAHVLGWAGADNDGVEGMELALDGRIRGREGRLYMMGDARGQTFLKAVRREPVPGHSVVLSIDETIQHIAERELAAAMESTGSASGSVVVMEPSTGDVLAIANHPTFNPNHPGDSEGDSRRNRAVIDAYEPGSTFKIITMAAAMEKGLLRPGDWFDCQNGSIRVSGVTLRDHKSFGTLTTTEVLQESSNVGAIKIGLRVPDADFFDTIRRFGFGAKTGIELPAEGRGLVRRVQDWSGISKATMSFGQELSVTPLQLATAVSAVANGGELRPPRLMLRELDAEGELLSKTALRPSRRVIEEKTAAALKQMMIAVVDKGTAKAARMPGYSVAGKTGTAQKIGPDGTYRGNNFIASFVGFVPSSRPALTILVMLDEPRGALYHGGDIAAPVFRRIALPALRYLGVPTEPGRGWVEDDEPTLVAHAHAKRWEHPVPLDEKERTAERERERRAHERELARERRLVRAGGRQETSGVDPEDLIPVARPLPASARGASGEVMVPDLRGHALRRAIVHLSGMGLLARVEADADGLPAGDGVVVEQDPPAGAIVRGGDEVRLRPGWRLPVPDPDVAAEDGSALDAVEDRAAAAPVAPARRSMR